MSAPEATSSVVPPDRAAGAPLAPGRPRSTPAPGRPRSTPAPGRAGSDEALPEPPANDKVRADGVIGRLASRHWRGEGSLPRSFWLGLALPLLLANSLLAMLAAWVPLQGGAWLRLGSAALLLAWPAALALTAWGAVGAWRAAAQHVGPGRDPVWIALSRVAVALLVLAMGVLCAIHFLPRLWDHTRLVAGVDPRGQLQALASPDGRRWRLQGHLGLHDAGRVLQAMATAPQVRLLELDLRGGRFGEAEPLAAALRGQGWQTRVTGQCTNACALLFMAGASRQLMPGAQLGFHREVAATFHPLARRWSLDEQKARYLAAGLEAGFVAKAMATPLAQRWVPLLPELAAAGAFNPQAHPLDVDLPSLPAPQPPELAEALSTHPVWQALESRHPGTLAEGAQRMHASLTAGAAPAETQVAGQRVIEALLPRLLFEAGTDLREQFAALLADQLAAAAQWPPGSCRAVLLGDAALRHAMPAALAQREAAWLADAAHEPPRVDPARNPSTLELEVVRRTLGSAAPAQLPALRRGWGADGRQCAAAQRLVAELRRLPPAERRLALRMMFEPG